MSLSETSRVKMQLAMPILIRSFFLHHWYRCQSTFVSGAWQLLDSRFVPSVYSAADPVFLLQANCMLLTATTDSNPRTTSSARRFRASRAL